MGLKVVVTECRVMLGVFGDLDPEPFVYLGTCEGVQHVPALVAEMYAHAISELGVRPMTDLFWSGSQVTSDLMVP